MDTIPLVIITIWLGAILLLVLCFHDFTQKVVKPSKAIFYYVALGLFGLTNLMIYLGLCAFFQDIDPLAYLLDPAGLGERNFSGLDAIEPIVIALLYFGTGIAVFKVGGKEINIYQLMLSVFQRCFEIGVAKTTHFQESLKKAQIKSGMLEEKIRDLRAEAERRHWDKLDEKWKDTRNDIELLDKQIQCLGDVDKQLNRAERVPTYKQVRDIARDVRKRHKLLVDTKVEKLKRYLLELSITNMKKEEDIERLLKELGVEMEKIYREPSIVLRCTIICAFFGLLFGPLYAITTNSPEPMLYSRVGAVALGVFGLIFSLIRSANWNVQDFLLRALVSGGAAGLAAHLLWMVLTVGEIEPKALVSGTLFGAGAALVVYLFRAGLIRIPRWQHIDDWLKYIAIGVAGSALFIILGYLTPDSAQENDPIFHMSVDRAVRLAALGSFTLLALAISLNLFRGHNR